MNPIVVIWLGITLFAVYALVRLMRSKHAYLAEMLNDCVSSQLQIARNKARNLYLKRKAAEEMAERERNLQAIAAAMMERAEPAAPPPPEKVFNTTPLQDPIAGHPNN